MNVWNKIITNSRKSKYPDLNFVRFVARNYFGGFPRDRFHFLDLGSGDGANTWFLENEGFRVTAIDGSPGARAHVHTDLATWDYPTGEYDCALDINSLCHIESPPFSKIRNALKHGGKFFSICPADDTWRGTLEGKGYCRCATAEQVIEMFEPFTGLRFGRAVYPDGEHAITSWIIEATK